MSLKLQVFEDVVEPQQQQFPDASLRKQLSQSDPKWFIKPSNYHHLAELEIYPRVFLGSQWEAKDPDWFQTHRISHVLNVSTLQNTFQKKPLYYNNLSSSNSSDPENTNPNIMMKNSNSSIVNLKNTAVSGGKQQVHVNYLKINVDDSTDVNVRKYFEKVIDFVRDALEGSPTNNVLIHCKEGKSRSVTMMLVFGMAYFDLTLYEAFKHFENKTFNRSRINLGFQLQLMNYEVELLEDKGVGKPKNSLDFLNQAAVSSCRTNATPPTIQTTIVEEAPKKNRRNTTKKTPLTDITNTGSAATSLQPPKAKKSTVKILPKKSASTPVVPTQVIPPIIIEDDIPAMPSILSNSSNSSIEQQENHQQQQPVTPLRSPIRSRRASQRKTPSSIIKIPFSTLDNASYISPMKNKMPPTPLGTPSINNDNDILVDDYSTLEFNFDEDDLEISKGLEDRVFMTTPLKKRKTDEDLMQ